MKDCDFPECLFEGEYTLTQKINLCVFHWWVCMNGQIPDKIMAHFADIEKQREEEGGRRMNKKKQNRR